MANISQHSAKNVSQVLKITFKQIALVLFQCLLNALE